MYPEGGEQEQKVQSSALVKPVMNDQQIYMLNNQVIALHEALRGESMSEGLLKLTGPITQTQWRHEQESIAAEIASVNVFSCSAFSSERSIILIILIQ